MVYNSFDIKTTLAKLSTDDADSNSGIAYKEIFKRRGVVPNVTGMGLKDALYVLGNSGLKPIISGSGQVSNQSILAGTPIIKGTKILIALQ
jgi:cell division protein FtsI (penicillin-binding protein 3)